jgi:hypothetical protein
MSKQDADTYLKEQVEFLERRVNEDTGAISKLLPKVLQLDDLNDALPQELHRLATRLLSNYESLHQLTLVLKHQKENDR